MYTIDDNKVFLHDKIICDISCECVCIDNNSPKWRIIYDSDNGVVSITIGNIYIGFIDPELIDISGDFCEKMEQVKNMFHNKTIDEELCDYVKTLIEKINPRFATIVDHIYVYDENDDSAYKEIRISELDLKLTEQLSKAIDIPIYEIIKSQILDVFISTSRTNMKSARK